MPDTQLTLTNEERECLANLLEMAVKDARIEEHRTRTPTYREWVLKREHLLNAILGKIGPAPKTQG